jgi:hypothetical protein
MAMQYPSFAPFESGGRFSLACSWPLRRIYAVGPLFNQLTFPSCFAVSLTLELQAKNLKYECAANPMKNSVTWRRIHYRSRVGTRDEFDSQSQPVTESQPCSQVEGEVSQGN